MDNIDQRLITGKPKPYLGSTYKWVERVPNAGASLTQTTAGGQQAQVELVTTNAWSPYNDHFDFTSTPTASGVNEYNWYYSNTLPMQSIDCYDSGTSTRLFRIDGSFNYYLDMVAQLQVHFADYIQRSKATGGGVDGWTAFPAPSRLIGTAASVGARYDATAVSYPYLERVYLTVGGNNTATPVMNYRFMMRNIPHSVWAVSPDIPLPNQLYITFTFCPSTQICFFGDSATDASSNATVYAGSIAISAMKYWQTINSNEVVQRALEQQMRSGEGMALYLPWVEATYRNFTTTTSVTQTIRANAGLGKKLQRIYSGFYPGTNTVAAVYNKSNLADAKVTDLYSQLNSRRIQNNNIDCSNQDDYALYREQVDEKGCAILDISSYKYNFVWCDTFDGTMINDKNFYDGGIVLNSEQTYDLVATTASAAYNVYSFAVYMQTYVIKPNGIFVAP